MMNCLTVEPNCFVWYLRTNSLILYQKSYAFAALNRFLIRQQHVGKHR